MRHLYILIVVLAIAFTAWPLVDTWRFPALMFLLIIYCEIHKAFWPSKRSA